MSNSDRKVSIGTNVSCAAEKIVGKKRADRGEAESLDTRNVDSRSAQYFSDGKEPVAGKLLGKKDGQELRHLIRPITSLKKYEGNSGAKLVCKICGGAHARYFCVSCSKVEHRMYFAVCGVKADGDCIAWHCQDS